MKKGLLIYRINKNDTSNMGVIQKMEGQIRAFTKLGFEIDCVRLGNEGVFFNDELIVRRRMSPGSLSLYWFYFYHFGRILYKKINYSGYDFIYLRHPLFDYFLVNYLKRIRAENPAIKFLLEINTYPYDLEPTRFLHKVSIWMDKLLRNKASVLFDRIISYGDEKEIFNRPVISIRNGVDTSSIPFSKRPPVIREIILIAVGNWSYWHGLDRILEGMNRLKKAGSNYLFKLLIIGPTRKRLKYGDMATKFQLESEVEFLGNLKGKELDKQFERSHIGVGTLALHRKQVTLNSSLKHREYFARGIPFILSGKDPDFEPVEDLIFVVPEDDSPIDLEGIGQKYESNFKKDRSQVIRLYAEKNLDWDQKIKPIKQWILMDEEIEN